MAAKLQFLWSRICGLTALGMPFLESVKAVETTLAKKRWRQNRASGTRRWRIPLAKVVRHLPVWRQATEANMIVFLNKFARASIWIRKRETRPGNFSTNYPQNRNQSRFLAYPFENYRFNLLTFFFSLQRRGIFNTWWLAHFISLAGLVPIQRGVRSYKATEFHCPNYCVLPIFGTFPLTDKCVSWP